MSPLRVTGLLDAMPLHYLGITIPSTSSDTIANPGETP